MCAIPACSCAAIVTRPQSDRSGGDLGRLEEAEAEHRAELAICTRLLGAEHPDTLTSQKNLALALAALA